MHRKRRPLASLGQGLLLAGALASFAGCSHPANVGEYFIQRGEDLLDCIDVGFTFTSEPYGSVYACLLGISSIGAGHVDGQFVGIGGGHIGLMRHYHKVCGLVLWTYEELGWDEFDITKPETLIRWQNGPIGYATSPERTPQYGFA